MSTQVLSVVLLAALLHAVWNAAVKASMKQRVPPTAIFIGAGIAAAAVVPFVAIPARESWPFLAASVAVHIVYSITLGRAYRSGDFSRAYPIMRGLPPLLTAILTTVFSEERLSAAQSAGMVALCFGILSLAFEPGPRSAKNKAAVGWALVVALCIGIYTTIDGFGGRNSGTPWGYVAWTCLLEAICLAALLWARKGGSELMVVAKSWRITLIGGATTLLAYCLVVWAMTQAPIALVSALRETSVIFAALLGVFIFKERLGPQRVLAIALVILGIFLTRLT